MKKALITAVTGQDGAYLAEFLLSKGYEVHGIKRRSSSFNTGRIDHLYQDPHMKHRNFILHYGDLTDATALIRVIQIVQPDEIYNLAAQSHVAVSFESPEYTANADDKKSYFDTWITFQRAAEVLTDADIVTNGQTATWIKYDQNDDSSELPKQPSGNKYNSLMRISTNTSDPTKALVVGLYRIGFTTYKTGDVQGSFIAQIGSVVEIPGVKIARDLPSLKDAVDKK